MALRNAGASRARPDSSIGSRVRAAASSAAGFEGAAGCGSTEAIETGGGDGGRRARARGRRRVGVEHEAGSGGGDSGKGRDRAVQCRHRLAGRSDLPRTGCPASAREAAVRRRITWGRCGRSPPRGDGSSCAGAWAAARSCAARERGAAGAPARGRRGPSRASASSGWPAGVAGRRACPCAVGCPCRRSTPLRPGARAGRRPAGRCETARSPRRAAARSRRRL